MKALAYAAAFAAALSPPALAVEVFTNSDPVYARQIWSWYEAAPTALKTRMQNPKVVVIKDNATVPQFRKALNMTPGDVTKYSKPGAFIGIAIKGVPGTQPRSIVFIEAGMKADSPYWQRKSVLHEMMHLFDGDPRIPNRRDGRYVQFGYHSDAPAFIAAWKADQRDHEATLARLSPADATVIKPWTKYYFSDPTEAFAEAGARMLIAAETPREKMQEEHFFSVFKRTSAYVEKMLLDASVLYEPRSKTVAK